MNDGPVTPDLSDIMAALRVLTKRVASIEHLLSEPPQSTFVPRKSPDERVMEEVRTLHDAATRLRSHVACGGSFPRKGVISALRHALSEIPEPVLTTIECEAAND